MLPEQYFCIKITIITLAVVGAGAKLGARAKVGAGAEAGPGAGAEVGGWIWDWR